MMENARALRLLFLCTHNSARSILAEALANQLGAGRLCAFSAGSHPSGRVHPLALAVLSERGCSIDSLCSKPWGAFATPPAEPMHVVITVCGNAAAETCPCWPGAPARLHWGLPDPSLVQGDTTVRMDAFRQTIAQLERRLHAALSIASDPFDPLTLQREWQRIHDEALRKERGE